MPAPLPQSLRRVRGHFWLYFTILALFLALSGCLVVLALQCRPANLCSEALLGGPGGFTFLAIVVALSAYLRGVANSADQKREKVLTDEKDFYRANEEVQKAKLAAIAGTSRNLQIAAPFMILLSILTGLRLFAESVARVGFEWPTKHRLAFLVADVLIVEYLVLGLIVLAISHHYARNRDERIREEVMAYRSAPPATGPMIS